VFNDEELTKITEACRDHRLGPAFLLVLYTGLRASETCGLRWRDVDLDRGTLGIHSTSHRVTKASQNVVGTAGLVEGRPKTDASGNEVPLHPAAVDLLR
jgi:integrase